MKTKEISHENMDEYFFRNYLMPLNVTHAIRCTTKKV